MNSESGGCSTDCSMDTEVKEKPKLDLEIETELEEEAIQFAMIQQNKHKNDDQIELNYESTLSTVSTEYSELTHLYRCTLCTKIWNDNKAFMQHASYHKDFLYIVEQYPNYAEIMLIKKPSNRELILNPRGNAKLFANASPGIYIHKCYKCTFYANTYEHMYEHFMQFHHDVKLPVFRHYCGCCKTAFTSENKFAEAHRSAFLCSCEMTHTSCVELYFHFNLSKCCLSYCPCGFVGVGIRTDSHIKACELIRLNRYYCPCGNHNTLFTHMKHLANCTSIPEYIFGCSFCPMSFHNKEGLINHINKYHKKNIGLKSIGVYINFCPLCGERINNEYFNLHIQRTHGAKIRYYCVCNTMFDNIVTWANHFNTSHSVEVFFNTIRKEEKKLNAPFQHAKFNCGYCGKGFNTSAYLDNHISKKMGVCYKCNATIQFCMLERHDLVFCIYSKNAQTKTVRTNRMVALEESEVTRTLVSPDCDETFPHGETTCLKCGDKIALDMFANHKEQCSAIHKSTELGQDAEKSRTDSDGDAGIYWRKVDADECSTAFLSISGQNVELAQLVSIATDSRVTTAAASVVANSDLTSDEHTADVIELSDDSVGSPPALHISDEEDNFSIEESEGSEYSESDTVADQKDLSTPATHSQLASNLVSTQSTRDAEQHEQNSDDDDGSLHPVRLDSCDGSSVTGEPFDVDPQEVKTELDVDMDGDINAFIINTRERDASPECDDYEAAKIKCNDYEDNKKRLNSVKYHCELCKFSASNFKGYIHHYKFHGYRSRQCPMCWHVINGSLDKLANHIRNHFIIECVISDEKANKAEVDEPMACTPHDIPLSQRGLLYQWELRCIQNYQSSGLRARNSYKESNVDKVDDTKKIRRRKWKIPTGLNELDRLKLYDQLMGTTLQDCSICDKKFVYVCSMKIHMIEHLLHTALSASSVSSLPCFVCADDRKNVVLQSPTMFRTHMGEHFGMKSHECYRCKSKKSSSHPQIVANHQKLHDIRDAQCHFCKIQFK